MKFCIQNQIQNILILSRNVSLSLVIPYVGKTTASMEGKRYTKACGLGSGCFFLFLCLCVCVASDPFGAALTSATYTDLTDAVEKHLSLVGRVQTIGPPACKVRNQRL